jgi:hypothetical protein
MFALQCMVRRWRARAFELLAAIWCHRNRLSEANSCQKTHHAESTWRLQRCGSGFGVYLQAILKFRKKTKKRTKESEQKTHLQMRPKTMTARAFLQQRRRARGSVHGADAACSAHCCFSAVSQAQSQAQERTQKQNVPLQSVDAWRVSMQFC